jgi:hypothetical protein
VTPLNTRLRSEEMDSLRFSTARAATPSADFGTGLISSLLRPRRASAVGKSSVVPRRDGFATAMCFGPRRSLRRSRNAAIILPTTTVTQCARAPPLLRRKLLRPFSKEEGRSAPVTRATSPSSSRAVALGPTRQPLASHAERGRALRAPSDARLRASLAAGLPTRRGANRVFTGSFALRRHSSLAAGFIPAVKKIASSLGRTLIAFARCQPAVETTTIHWVARSSHSPVALRPLPTRRGEDRFFTGPFARRLRPLPTRRGAKSALLSALVLPSLADRAARRGRRPTVTLRHTVRLTLVYSRART